MTRLTFFCALAAICVAARAADVGVLIDADGQTVGPVLDEIHTTDLAGVNQLQGVNVVFRVQNRGQLTLTVGRQGFFPCSTRCILYFESPDCTGTPYFLAVPKSITNEELFVERYAQVSLPGRTLYMKVAGATREPILYQSRLDGRYGRCTFGPPSRSEYLLRAEPVLDLATRFRPPFRFKPSASVQVLVP